MNRRLNSIYSKMRMSTLSHEEFLEAVERRRDSEYSPAESGRVNTLRHSLFAENNARSAGSAVLVCFVRALQKHSASEPDNGKQQLHVLLTQRTLTLRAHPGPDPVAIYLNVLLGRFFAIDIKSVQLKNFRSDFSKRRTNGRTFLLRPQNFLAKIAIA